MDRLGSGSGGDLEQGVDLQVALGRRARADEIRLVGAPDVQRVTVELGVDGHRADPELLQSADHAHGDLAAIGHQDLGEHAAGLYLPVCCEPAAAWTAGRR